MDKRLGLVVLLGLFLLPVVLADHCNNVTLSVTQPEDLNYTYSINIPLVFTQVNASGCWVELDSDKFKGNITLDCSESEHQFDVDYDGNYTAIVWAENSTDSGDCNITKTFMVDRTSEFEDNKVTLVSLLIFSLIIVGFFTVHFSSHLSAKFKTLVLALSFLFVYSALGLILLSVREYLKVPAIFNNLESIFSMTIYASLLIASLILFYFIINVIKNLANAIRKKRFGGDNWDEDY